ncbi:MAG: O-antigen polysaccharide polymerase Wzy, partial [Ferruginibacter sp.]|nr:O-antigen polysaccharide polymerase Wzy [Ferruginibacter sp.]
FMKYSGMRIKRGTSMGLSSLGDAYVNFGTFGGAIFMFILGFIYSEVLNVFHKKSKDYPVLILFTTLVFYYPIRPDCELQTILGHLVKSCFLIYIVLIVWQKEFRLWPASMWKKSLS